VAVLLVQLHSFGLFVYRRSSVVCRSVDDMSVTIVNLQKTAEPIKMLHGMWTQVGQRKHVLDGSARLRHVPWRIRLNRPYAAVMQPSVNCKRS